MNAFDADTTHHEQRIHTVLARVYRAGGYEAVEHRTPLSELLAAEDETEDERELRREGFRRALIYLFGDGPHPAAVCKRAFALAKAIDPELIAHMSLQDIGMMLGETRAAQSWRIKKIFSRKLTNSRSHERTTRTNVTQANFQKRKGASLIYAARAKGNHNRTKKKRAEVVMLPPAESAAAA
jgi:hypothetical protein